MDDHIGAIQSLGEVVMNLFIDGTIELRKALSALDEAPEVEYFEFTAGVPEPFIMIFVILQIRNVEIGWPQSRHFSP